MILLDEWHVGFDPSVLAFPSIFGCHAVALLTKQGLYGVHNFGGAETEKHKDRSDGFAAFVKPHNRFVAADMLHLYGTCFRTTQRGYGTDQEAKWKQEMKAFAKALKYHGPVSGFNLDTVVGWPRKPGSPTDPDSAYVEYRKIFDECYIQVAPWSHMDDTGRAQEIPDSANRQQATPNGKVKLIARGSEGKRPYHITTSVKAGETGYIRASQLDTFKV